MYELKTNTAARIAVGPLVDPTDGKTAETALTVTDLSVQLYQIKNDGSAVVRTQFAPTASGGNNDMALVTSSTDGMYDLELTAAQLNFLGNGRISFYDLDGFLVHWIDILIVSAAYFDWKYGSTIPNVNATQISGDSDAADNLEAAFDGAGYAGGTIKPKVDLDTIKTQAITCGAGVTIRADVGMASQSQPQTGDAYARLGAPAGASVSADVAALKAETAAILVDTGTTLDDLIDTEIATIVSELAKVPKSDSNVSWNATALGAINAEVDTALNTAIPGSPTADSINERIATMDTTAIPAIKTVVDTIQADTDLLDDAAGGLADIHTDVAAVKTVVDAILVDTGTTLDDLIDTEIASIISELAKVPKSDSNVTWNATALASINAEVDTALNTAIPASNTADSMNDILLDQVKAKLPTNYIMGSAVQTAKDDEIDAIKAKTDNLPASPANEATLTTIAGYLDTEIAAILADTNELQTDWANGGRLDLILDAASAPSAAAVADAVWDEVLSGHLGAGSTGNALNAAGSAGDPWATAIPGAYGAGTAGLLLGTTIPNAIDAIDNYVDTEIGALTSELAKVPKSDSNVSWNATALAAINAEMDTALNTAIPGSPTADSINERIATMDTTAIPAIKTVVDTIQADTDLLDDVSGGLADIHTDIGTVITNIGAVKTVVDTIQADTDLLDDVSGGLADIHTDVGTAITNIGAVKTVVDTIQADTDLLDDAVGGLADIHTDIGTLQSMLTDIHGTDLPAVKTVVDGIEVHVHTTIPALIPSAADIKTAVEAAGSHLTLIKAKTDKMTYTSGDDLDVNVQKINDVTLAGDGSGTPMGAV